MIFGNYLTLGLICPPPLFICYSFKVVAYVKSPKLADINQLVLNKKKFILSSNNKF